MERGIQTHECIKAISKGKSKFKKGDKCLIVNQTEAVIFIADIDYLKGLSLKIEDFNAYFMTI